VSGRILAIGMVAVVLVVGVVGWFWLDIGGVRQLPGTPLVIETDPPPPSGFVCGSDVVPPARLLVDGDALVVVAADGGADLPVAWPAGYAARDDQGHGGVYDPDGYLVAQTGETIQERFFGSVGADGVVFHICRVARD